MLKHSTIENFDKLQANRRLICFGAGENFKEILFNHKWKVSMVVDGDESKIGTVIDYLTVGGWREIEKRITDGDILLITPVFFKDIYNKIMGNTLLKECDVYIYDLMKRLQYDADRDKYERRTICIGRRMEKRIPPIIHYFWFSGDPFPDSVKECIESWKRFCPEFKIIKWDMNNYDFSRNRFALEAIKCRKWAFASDFARADVIYRYGGIYLDTDVELIRDISDLLYNDAFIGFQDNDEIDPGSGFGATPGNSIVREFMDIYKDISFEIGEGKFNTIACPVYYTEVLENHGLVKNGAYQVVDGFTTYPYDFLCPHSYRSGRTYCSHNTYSIHHHKGGWLNKEIKEREQLAHCLLAND